MSDFDISYNLNYGSMARGEQQVNLWARPSLLHTGLGLTQTAVRVVNYLLFSSHASCLRRTRSNVSNIILVVCYMTDERTDNRNVKQFVENGRCD